jgi:hypothetical protein
MACEVRYLRADSLPPQRLRRIYRGRSPHRHRRRHHATCDKHHWRQEHRPRVNRAYLKQKRLSSRQLAIAKPTPITVPMPSQVSVYPITTRPRSAPNAVLIPISGVLCATR